MTDDYGQSQHRFPTGRPITNDGKLVWVPWQIGDKAGYEFFYKNKNLGQISLDDAMKIYQEAEVNTEELK